MELKNDFRHGGVTPWHNFTGVLLRWVSNKKPQMGECNVSLKCLGDGVERMVNDSSTLAYVDTLQ